MSTVLVARADLLEQNSSIHFYTYRPYPRYVDSAHHLGRGRAGHHVLHGPQRWDDLRRVYGTVAGVGRRLWAVRHRRDPDGREHHLPIPERTAYPNAAALCSVEVHLHESARAAQ